MPACPSPDRGNFLTLQVGCDYAAPVATRQKVAVLFECILEAGEIVRPTPGRLKDLFDFSGIEIEALGLLPFRQRKIQRIFPAVGAALFRRIADLLGESPGIRPEDVFVTVLDAAKENWSVGHGLAQFA